MNAERVAMQTDEFRLIKEYVAETVGLVLEDGTEKSLAAKLRPRLEALRLRNFTEYYCYLKLSPEAGAELLRFVPLITNNETYFFREANQLYVLQEVLSALKQRKLAKGERNLRILSAGCSSGEEAYTIAMLLLESGQFSWDWDVRITGIDIDQRVLDTAGQGIYRHRSFRAMEPQLMERYLKPCGEDFIVRDVVRKRTHFAQGNLIDLAATLPGADFDIILCRNVLIYFANDTVKRVVDNFSSLQSAGAYLFLGHSEFLSGMQVPYLPLRFPGAIIYQKRA